MDKEKEREEISLIGRIFSLEVLLFVMGIFSLASGLLNGKGMQIILGVVIIGGSVILFIVRKRLFRKN